MHEFCPHSIVFSEWLPTGVVVHFEGNVSVFFSARFLYEQREDQENQIFCTVTPCREDYAADPGELPRVIGVPLSQ
jgi:hypothetical protein